MKCYRCDNCNYLMVVPQIGSPADGVGLEPCTFCTGTLTKISSTEFFAEINEMGEEGI